MKIYAFDFDGTLTTRDTLIDFIRFVRGDKATLLGLLRFSPLLLLMKMGIYPNGKCKRQLFTYFFKGMREGVFNDFCETYAHKRKSILRPAAMEKLREVQQEGHTVVVVSANMDSWVRLFLPGIEVIGTKVEVMNERLTGRFYTRNCYGKEKVRRFLERFPERNTYELIVYGDSRGDHELLDIADEGYYKPFRK